MSFSKLNLPLINQGERGGGAHIYSHILRCPNITVFKNPPGGGGWGHISPMDCIECIFNKVFKNCRQISRPGEEGFHICSFYKK